MINTINSRKRKDIYYTKKLKEFVKYSKQHIHDKNYYKYLGIKTQNEFDSEGITPDVGLKRCLRAIKETTHFIYLDKTQYYMSGLKGYIPVPDEVSYAFIIPINLGATHKYMMFIANKNTKDNKKFFVSWHLNDKKLSSSKYHWVIKDD